MGNHPAFSVFIDSSFIFQIDIHQSGYSHGAHSEMVLSFNKVIAMTLSIDQRFLVALRLLLAWVFLYAASHQVFDPQFSIVGFMNSTKTFHGLFVLFTGESIAPVVSFLVAYGHLAIGLSLLFGCLVRISAICGAVILFLYWMAHMDFPYISDVNSFLVDFHIVYIVVLLYLAYRGAGQFFGLDAALARMPVVQTTPLLMRVVG
jgi:thiosulfate dehydrogenase (quinone) large subunit